MRAELRNSNNLSYLDMLQALGQPNYVLVWRDILTAHAGIGLVVSVLFLYPTSTMAAIVLGVIGGVALGFLLHYLLLFFHEAAHFLVAPSIKLNDLAANILIGPFFFYPVTTYRSVHFGHHRYLGTPRDPEHSYIHPLSPGFLFEALIGLHALKTYLQHRRANNEDNPTNRGASFFLTMAFAVALHGGVLSLAIFTESWGVVVAWFVGVLIVFPFLGALRQLLEHRRFGELDGPEAFRVRDHGEVLRSFQPGFWAKVIGAAGFSNHVIHHLEPQVSYQHLSRIEAFLLDTPLRDWLAACKVDYVKAWHQLYQC